MDYTYKFETIPEISSNKGYNTIDLDELDEAWVLAVSDENTVAYRTVNGALSLCEHSKTTDEMQLLTPEIISRSKIKPFIFQE